MSLANIESEYKLIQSWNLTYSQKIQILYPSSIKELKNIINFCKKKGKTFAIRTGECSYDSKSIALEKNGMIISLKKLNKIIRINKKDKLMLVESGAKISDLIYFLKKKNLTLYSVPGGEHISVGGAISANVIGKDSSKLFASFGDSIKSIKIISYNGNIKKLYNNSKEFFNYIGSFGMFGIILEANIKTKKIISNNLLLETKILKNIEEVEKELKKADEYKYIQIDPFFRKKFFGSVFKGNYIKSSESNYKNINLKTNFYEKVFFRTASFFINSITWRIFYRIFFQSNADKKTYIDIHNFHYSSKYKHMVPLICKKGLIDYEVMLKKEFCKDFDKIEKFITSNKLMPIYIIIKKLFKSKKKFFYSFNNTGYSVAMAFDLKSLNQIKKNKLENFFKKRKLLLNLSKTDTRLIKKKNKVFSKNKKIFMSLYKKKLIGNKYEISR